MPRLPTTAFLDRDGVLNRKTPEGHYVTSWAEFEFLPGAVAGLRALRAAGVRLVVVTNQRGVALGRMSEEALEDIHRRMEGELARAGVELEAVLACPHDEGTCDCRKPRLGLFREAERRLGIDVATSIVVGDSLVDIVAGNRLGCPSYLVGDPAGLGEAAAGLRIAGAGASLLDVVSSCLGLPEPGVQPAPGEPGAGSARTGPTTAAPFAGGPRPSSPRPAGGSARHPLRGSGRSGADRR